MKTASIIIIGNEILSGRTQDTNSNYLAKILVDKGILLEEVRVIPDDYSIIESVVNNESTAKDYVFTSGGIGPTHDDITAEAIANCFDAPLVIRDDAVELLAMNYKNGKKDLNAAAKLSPMSSFICTCPTPSNSYSTGSSAVKIFK